jgi:hypothetical protein
MQMAAVSDPTRQPGPDSPRRRRGFPLLEMMMVVTVIFEAVSSQPSAFS